MEESQTPDLQAMITAAVAAAMEQATSKSLQTNPEVPRPTSKRVHYKADSEDSDSSREHSQRRKRHWKGNVTPRKAKGKAPADRRKATVRATHDATQLSSGEEDVEPTQALAVLDEWQAAASDQGDSDRDSTANSDPYFIREQGL
ncbi:Hypothetical predicted protein, partial [Pelobates cultripes]